MNHQGFSEWPIVVAILVLGIGMTYAIWLWQKEVQRSIRQWGRAQLKQSKIDILKLRVQSLTSDLTLCEESLRDSEELNRKLSAEAYSFDNPDHETDTDDSIRERGCIAGSGDPSHYSSCTERDES